MSKGIPRLVVAGIASSVGKTTFTVGLCGALRKRGLRVSVFKCGPDYLDPAYHFRAAGVRSQTLDTWMMGRAGVLSAFHHASQNSDIAVIEGVMGLFDGIGPDSDAGSTAEIAKWLSAPVLLVIDTSGMARSTAAVAVGFSSFDTELNIAGIICNRIGGRGHLELLKRACPGVLGGLPLDTANAFPERHLGLVAPELPLPEAWADHVAEWCDVARIVEIARAAPELSFRGESIQAKPSFCRIGVARDEAFHFYYDENLRLLQHAGAELIEFSPIHSAHLPDVDAILIGGGYPEVHAEALANNVTMRAELHAFCAGGGPVYAECGGLMYLCDIGWFPARAVVHDRLQAIGYAEAVTTCPTILGPAGQSFRGHQFRYSTLEWTGATALRLICHPNGKQLDDGYVRGNVFGSWTHAHWASNPAIPEQLVSAAAARKQRSCA